MSKKDSPTESREGWKELSPIWVKFEEPGDTIEGKLIDVGKGGMDSNVYTVENDQGIFYFFGGAQLDKILPSQKGNLIKVTYSGEETTKGGRTVKVYKVWAKAVVKDDQEKDIPF